MKFENVSDKDKKKIIDRAVGYENKFESINDCKEYIKDLENALVQSVLNRTNQRRELQRLNQQVRHINEVALANTVLGQECVALQELLERAEDANDTDPSQLAPSIVPANNGAEDPEAARLNNWDMKTRYPDLKPRDVGMVRAG